MFKNRKIKRCLIAFYNAVVIGFLMFIFILLFILADTASRYRVNKCEIINANVIYCLDSNGERKRI